MPDNAQDLARHARQAMNAGVDAAQDGRSRVADALRDVIRDAERMLRDAGDASRDGLDSARTQLEQTLASARERLLDAEDVARARLSRAAYATNDYVSENPLRALLLAAAVGAVVAWVVTRSRGGDDLDDYEAAGYGARDYDGA